MAKFQTLLVAEEPGGWPGGGGGGGGLSGISILDSRGLVSRFGSAKPIEKSVLSAIAELNGMAIE